MVIFPGAIAGGSARGRDYYGLLRIHSPATLIFRYAAASAALNFTLTSRLTPGSCMVTP